ncbi:DUF58 domain-containing protein [Virgibacillus proomii]|uniref:DUF58 domain-containing protein n=1 Tax=Virgibacillus proomii TaxID=84407 RepID=UPI00098465FB|nr:DUF58 domain-containing protein [Virgibacillus proomii]
MKLRFRALISCLFIATIFIGLYSYAMFQGGFVSWFLFFSFVPILVYEIAFLLYPLKKWTISRKLTHHMIEAGDADTLHMMIKRFPFPLFYCICEEVVPESLMMVDPKSKKYQYINQPNKLVVKRNLKKVISPVLTGEFSFTYPLHQVPRGEHYFTAVRIKIGDLFGFVKKEHVFFLRDLLVVYPRTRPFVLNEKINSFQHGGVMSSSFRLSNSNVATGIREYMPGDRFSWIDWKQTARKNRMMTKEFEKEKSTNILIVLDCCKQSNHNSIVFEGMVEVTASLLAQLKKLSTQAGLLTVGKATNFFPPFDDPGKAASIKQHLASIQPGDHANFALQLKSEMEKLRNDNIMIIIIGQIDHFLPETLKQLRQRSRRVIVLFVQPANKQGEHASFVKQVSLFNIEVYGITEQQLTKTPLEVKGL